MATGNALDRLTTGAWVSHDGGCEMRGAAQFLVPFGLTLIAGFGLLGWMSYAPPPSGAPVSVPLAELSLSGPRYVSVSGVAHYGSVVTQRTQGGLLAEPATWSLFGLFPDGDLAGREIKVLVRTMRAPERLVSFEYLTVEGALMPPDPRLVPMAVRDALADGGEWWLADDVLVLDPVRIVSEDGVWVEP